MSAGRDTGSQLRALRLEAARWLLRLDDNEPDPGETDDQNGRNEAFLDWLADSPQNVQAFLEVFETRRRLSALVRAG